MQQNLGSFVMKHIQVKYFEVNMFLRYDNLVTETTNELKLVICDFSNWPFNISYTSLFTILDALM